jgi:Flp pilus assembly protein TadD
MNDRLAALKLALQSLRDGDFALAEDLVVPWLATNPADIEALLIQGLARGGRGDAGGAATDLLRLAALRPDASHPILDLVTILRPLGKLAAAAPVVRAALALAPDDRSLCFAAAQIWLDLGDPAESLRLLDQLVGVGSDPVAPRTLVLRGIVRCEANDFTGGIADFRAALALAPNDASALSNLGIALGVEGHFADALSSLDRACRLAPADARLHLNRAITLLKAGNWQHGLAAFEYYRVRVPGREPIPLRPLMQPITQPPPPLLEPGAPLAGRTILLTHAEGFGDTIQYLRYVPILVARGARVLLLLPPPLVRLAASLTVPSGAVEVLTDPARLPHFDAHATFPRLALLCGAQPGGPPAAAYLQADPALAAAWSSRLPPRRPGALRRVGVVWAGHARTGDAAALAIDRHRSMDVNHLAPLAALDDVILVSLQMGPPAAQQPPAGLSLFDPMHEVADFADTAAIIVNLDAVVSVDTSVVHLSGALGIPVLMVDRYDHCWRWTSAVSSSETGLGDSNVIDMHDGVACYTPWYRSLRIFRQVQPGDWSIPIARVVNALKTHDETYQTPTQTLH